MDLIVDPTQTAVKVTTRLSFFERRAPRGGAACLMVEGKIPMAARRQVTNKLRTVCARASKRDKARILDEMLSTTGMGPLEFSEVLDGMTLSPFEIRPLLSGLLYPPNHPQWEVRAITRYSFEKWVATTGQRLSGPFFMLRRADIPRPPTSRTRGLCGRNRLRCQRALGLGLDSRAILGQTDPHTEDDRSLRRDGELPRWIWLLNCEVVSIDRLNRQRSHPASYALTVAFG